MSIVKTSKVKKMIQNWLKIAFKNYKKNWVSTFINIFGLTMGFTCLIIVILHWTDEAKYGAWNPNKEQVYFVQPYYDSDAEYAGNLSYPMAIQAKESIPQIEEYLLINGTGAAGKMDFGNKSIYASEGIICSEKFFDFFPYKLISGSYKNVINTKEKIAISANLSEQLFGKKETVGEIIQYDGQPLTISAVYELPKDNKLIKPNFILLSRQLEKDKDQWGNFNYNLLIKVSPNTDLKKLEKDFYKNVMLERAKVQTSSEKADGVKVEDFLRLYGPNGVEFTRIDNVNLYSKAYLFKQTPIKTLKILLGISAMILLLSTINFINLKTAQASQRAKEVGVRKAIGSNKTSLIWQFMLEAFIICLFAYGLSILALELILPYFNKFFNKEIDFWDSNFFILGFLSMLFISMVAGIIPALYLSAFKPINTLKGNFSRSKHGVWLRNSILGIQIIISSFFIIGGIVIHLQVKYMMNKDLGYNGSQMINIWFKNWNDPSKPYEKYERIKSIYQNVPGVETVTFGEAIPPGYSTSSSNMDYLDKSITGQHGSMDFNFLETMGVELLKGRWLSSKYSSDTINNVIINEAFARDFGWTVEEALGKEFKPGFDYQNYKVVGIVKDFNVKSLKNKTNPIVFFHYLETEWKRNSIFYMQMKLKPDNLDVTLKKVEEIWRNKIEIGYPFDYYFIDKEFAKTFEKYQKQRTLFGILNAVVLIVALLGLFALSALLIEQKLKTVAIKKTLGASNKTLVFGLTKQFLIITVIAVLISFPISYYFMNEWLKDFAYRIEMPWWPYLLSLILLLALTFAVVSFKAYRATQISLVKYLKYE